MPNVDAITARSAVDHRCLGQSQLFPEDPNNSTLRSCMYCIKLTPQSITTCISQRTAKLCNRQSLTNHHPRCLYHAIRYVPILHNMFCSTISYCWYPTAATMLSYEELTPAYARQSHGDGSSQVCLLLLAVQVFPTQVVIYPRCKSNQEDNRSPLYNEEDSKLLVTP